MQLFNLNSAFIIASLLYCISAVDYYAPGRNLGCYSSISGGTSKGTYNYQSSGYCLAQCGSSNYVAVKGEECICLNSLPASSNQESSSSCNTPCPGYGQEMCGDDDSYSLYESMNSNNNAQSSSNGGSSSSASGSGASASSSNSPSSTTQSTSSDSETSNTSSITNSPSVSSTEGNSQTNQERSTQVVVSTISHDNGSVIYSTITQSASETSDSTHSNNPSASSTDSSSTTTESSSSTTTEASSNSQNKSSNLAPIIGGVVGGVAGIAAIAAAIFFFLRYKKNHDDDEYDDEEEFYDDKYSNNGFINRTNNSTKGSRKANKQNPLEMPMTNPFVHPHDDLVDNNSSITDFNNNSNKNVSLGRSKTTNANAFTDPRLNPVMMGRRRLSEGSLVDETDYPRKVLQVANPDRL